MACGNPSASLQEHVFTGTTMGTTYTVKVVAGVLPESEREGLQDRIAATLDEVDATMSTYREDSELSRFNRHPAGVAFEASPAMRAILETAREVHQRSGGAFDPTVGPLVDLWGFGPSRDPEAVPSNERVEELRLLVGFDRIDLETLTKPEAGVAIDLSAIAKGFAVDRVAERIAALGFPSFMVEVGGEVRTAGRNRHDKPWRIAIEKPQNTGRSLQRVVSLSGLALATSGDYRNFYEIEGVRYSHTLDPRSGRPVEHSLASASVVDPSCAVADAWATALMVLGPEPAYEMAVSESLAALLLTYRGDGLDERMTAEFRRLLDEQGVD